MKHLVLKLVAAAVRADVARRTGAEPTATTTAQTAARPQRTEAEARARAEANRKEREAQRVKSGAPVELIADYVKANIGPVPESLGVIPSIRSTPMRSAFPSSRRTTCLTPRFSSRATSSTRCWRRVRTFARP